MQPAVQTWKSLHALAILAHPSLALDLVTHCGLIKNGPSFPFCLFIFFIFFLYSFFFFDLFVSL